MSTDIRPEVSAKNKYWIDKHRYYELKHFCLQYPRWKKLCGIPDGYSRQSEPGMYVSTSEASDPVFRAIAARAVYLDHIEMLERVAKETDSLLGNYILAGVTTGVSYDRLYSKIKIPCSKDTYYGLYRRFFWLLSRERA
ncbi:MAG: hypothetical protein LUG25_03575 [Oscillospiraceae bacterium]|nr:hypothetical protein [Oscillospiraceae bacterium]